MIRIQDSREDEGFVRLTTHDTELLLPALAQAGAAFRLRERDFLDVIGIDADAVAVLAALHNARVLDLETVAAGGGDASAGWPEQTVPRSAA